MCSPSAPSPSPDPPLTGTVPLRLHGTDQPATLTRTQRAFQRWIERIEAQRQQLVEWEAFAATFQSRVARDYEPLQRKYHAQRFMLLRRLDQAHDSGVLVKREQGRLGRVIVEQVLALLETDRDPVLVALHDKYSDRPYDRGDHADRAPGPTDEPSESGDSAQAHADGEDAQARAGTRAEARAEARAERAQARAQADTQSVRDAWRRLASALHPDREPDPTERERKTGLMQRANRAYEAGDLLQLLALQVEAEQVDPRQLAQASEARIARYNRVLKEQSEGLAAEIDAITARFGGPGGRPRRGGPTPVGIMAALDRDIAEVRQHCRWLAQDLEAFKDVGQVKAWLKSLQGGRRSSG